MKAFEHQDQPDLFSSGGGPSPDWVPLADRMRPRNFSEFVDGIVITFRCKPFQKICLATFLVFNAFNTVAAFSWFIVVYYMHQGDAALAGKWPTLFGSVSALFTCFLVIPVITWMSQRLGKKQTFLFRRSTHLN